jgi:dodecin
VDGGESPARIARKLAARAGGNRAMMHKEDAKMADSVYKVIELVGTSTESWEKAATMAVETAAKSLRGLRVAQIVELDMHLEEGKVLAYRAKVKVSFKYEGTE